MCRNVNCRLGLFCTILIEFIIKFGYNKRFDWLKQPALSEYRYME